MDNAPFTSRWAALDIGSHTIRLLIAESQGENIIVPVCRRRRITRLAKNFSQSLTLDHESIEDSLEALNEYAELLSRYGVGMVNSGATGVLRKARNAAEFLVRVREATGIEAAVLTEEEEALISTRGMLSVLSPLPPVILCIDIGGSSTELMLVDTAHSRSLWNTSIFLGAATLSERFLFGDPPEAPALLQAESHARDALQAPLSELAAVLDRARIPDHQLELVGTAGTITTLASMFLEMAVYEPSRVNGVVLSASWLDQVTRKLSRSTLAERRMIPGLERGREAIILGGTLIVLELMKMLELPRMTTVDSGLIEGLLIGLIEKHRGWASSLFTPLTWRFLN